MSSMITFEEALQITLNSARLFGSEHVELQDALGRVLAEDASFQQVEYGWIRLPEGRPCK